MRKTSEQLKIEKIKILNNNADGLAKTAIKLDKQGREEDAKAYYLIILDIQKEILNLEAMI